MNIKVDNRTWVSIHDVCLTRWLMMILLASRKRDRDDDVDAERSKRTKEQVCSFTYDGHRPY